MRKLIIIAGGILLVLIGYSSFFTVDRTEYVYLTQFGRPIATFDGLDEGGLHWKWPWPIQSVARLDRRLQYFDLPETELLTREKSVEGDNATATSSIDKNITINAYVCWRIAGRDNVDRFIRRVATPEQARRILGDQIRGHLAATIGKKRLDDLISTDQDKVDRSMEEVHRQLIDSMQSTAADSYGVEIVDIRLRRTSHPMQVRETIFDRIRSERFTKAQRERDEGEAISRKIRSEADAEAATILSEATQNKRLREEEGKAKAGEIRLKAYSQDREFAEKLIQMAKVLEALNPSKSVILVSMRDAFWKQLRGPDGENRPPAGKGSTDATPRGGP
jgi:membrane protease subunit HflC